MNIRESENGMWLVMDTHNKIIQVCVTEQRAKAWMKQQKGL